MSRPLRIALADDSVLFRRGLGLLLEAAGLKVVLTAGSPDDVLAALEQARGDEAPEVVVIDVRMPPTHTDEGIVLAGQLRRCRPELGLCVLSTYLEPSWALRLLDQVPDRVGYLLKDRVGEVTVLLEALERVAAGGIALDPDVITALVAARRGEARLSRLTERELDVLALLAEGRSNAGIADRLVLSTRTVENHVANIFRALQLDDDESGNRRVQATLAFLSAD